MVSPHTFPPSPYPSPARGEGRLTDTVKNSLPLRRGRARVGEDHMNPPTSILPRKGEEVS